MSMPSNLHPRFHRDPHVVKVENIAQSVTVQEVVSLFSSLIGEVSACSGFVGDKNRRFLEISFYTQDAAKKALCMSGYTVSGVALTVTLPRSDSHRSQKLGRQPDARRNLYVLGLPFDLTKAEFTELFSRYGTVSHAVILATVDNASRRRGFVVMSTHNEAKAAMDALSRKELKGHTMDVSWAVVQRSQGFLDGGDRTVMLSNQSAASSPAPSLFDLDGTSAVSSRVQSPAIMTPPPESQTPDNLSVPSAPIPALLVSNLPAALFSSTTDLHPLLCPFGEVKKLQIIRPMSISDPTSISVLVEYSTLEQAKEAHDMLEGQIYANRPLKLDFLDPLLQRPTTGLVRLYSAPEINTRLNPYATPFSVAPAAKSEISLRPLQEINNHSTSSLLPNGLVGSSHQASAPGSTVSLPSTLYPPSSSIRPNSAPSLWAADANIRTHQATPWTCAAQNWPGLLNSSLRSPYSA